MPLLKIMSSVTIVNALDYLNIESIPFADKLIVMKEANDDYFDMIRHHPDMEAAHMSELMELRSLTEKPDVKEGMYKCPRCGSKRTLSYQKQTRSADEPMTDIIKCTECPNKWHR